MVIVRSFLTTSPKPSQTLQDPSNILGATQTKPPISIMTSRACFVHVVVIEASGLTTANTGDELTRTTANSGVVAIHTAKFAVSASRARACATDWVTSSTSQGIACLTALCISQSDHSKTRGSRCHRTIRWASNGETPHCQVGSNVNVRQSQ